MKLLFYKDRITEHTTTVTTWQHQTVTNVNKTRSGFSFYIPPFVSYLCSIQTKVKLAASKLPATKEIFIAYKIMYTEPDDKYAKQTGAPSAQTRTCAK
jgi:hypothetical protein